MIIKSNELTGTDGGCGNYYTLVRDHRTEKVGRRWHSGSGTVLPGGLF